MKEISNSQNITDNIHSGKPALLTRLTQHFVYDVDILILDALLIVRELLKYKARDANLLKQIQKLDLRLQKIYYIVKIFS